MVQTKKISILFALVILLVSNVLAQQTKGFKIVDAETNSAIESAFVYNAKENGYSNEQGIYYVLYPNAADKFTISIVGYQEIKNISSPTELVIIKLVRKSVYLENLELKSIKSGTKSPFVKSVWTKEDIVKNNTVQDLPYILQQNTSVVVNSDAGTGVGYTGIRIRGTDATRINFTVNGIPYNDAESQGVFLVNMPDLASSVNSIQVQRGVGSSSNGTGAFGASIHLSTNEFREEAYAEVNNVYGSFNTWRNTVKVGTGLINKHFTVDARISRIASDGYIQRASSDLKSFLLSAAYLNNKTSLRFNIISGKEKTYQAWNGVYEDSLKTNRTYNELGTEKPGKPYDNQTDNYQQDHYQFFVNHQFNNKWSLSVANFLTYGRGYYEEYKANRKYADYFNDIPYVLYGNDTMFRTDLVRQLWLDNYFYGQTASVKYNHKKNELILGGGWSRYDGNHFGKVIWAQNGGVEPGKEYYRLKALKTDNNIYVKWQHAINQAWQFYADVQYRQVYHRMDGFRNNPTLYVAKQFDFINPKFGLTYRKNNWQLFASYALGQKEPNRDDFEANTSNLPKAEMLHDVEVGLTYKKRKYQVNITLFNMQYTNQLVNIGQMNSVGAYTRVNVDNSYRRGIEAEVSYVFKSWLKLTANATYSMNKIDKFVQYADNYDDPNGNQIAFNYSNTDIAFSPAFISAHTWHIQPYKSCTIELLGKYVESQYLDNTQNKTRSLSDYYTQDVRLIWNLDNKFTKQCKFIVQVNNVFNRKYESNGAAYPYYAGGVLNNYNYYFPMAGTNFITGLQVTF